MTSTTNHEAAQNSEAPAQIAAKYTKARLLAARLGLHPKTILRWGEAGRINRYKINGRIVLFDVAEVEAFVKSARVG